MPRRMAQWLRRQFVMAHSRRDEDLEHWWQMPDDRTRVTSSWRQVGVDLVTPATFSEWHERITETRVKKYDRLRPTVVRALLLCVLAASLGFLDAPWWVWMFLTPAALQVSLEVYLDRFAADSSPDPRWPIMMRIRDMSRRHFNTTTLNVTGILGTVACPLNLVAACVAPAGDDHAWLKIAALAAAVFYLNSGLASTFLDPPNYTETSVMPPVMHFARPYVPLISFAVVIAMVAGSAGMDRWESSTLPIAYLCSTLTLLLGSTIRNHDRMVAAGAAVARQAVEDGRKILGQVVHDDLGLAKAAAESVSRVPGVAYPDVVDLRALAAYLKHFNTRVGLYASQRMHLDYVVDKLVNPYGISPRQVSFDIEWDEEKIRREDHQVAIRMVTALVHNVAQALERTENHGVPKSFTVHGFTTGHGRELRYHLAVRDHLPLIADAEWQAVGGSLDALRTWLRKEFNGSLHQQDLGDGTKQIVASWDDRSPAHDPGSLDDVAESVR